MRWKTRFAFHTALMITAALAISCRGNGATRIAEFSNHHQTLPASITVVVWNAQKGHHPQFSEDLRNLLEQEKPDIVFLQEARADLIEPQAMGGYFAEGWRYPWPGGDTIGVLTLSRAAPVRIESVPTRYRELGVIAPKVSLVTEYRLPTGENLLAVNVHLLNFERWSVKKIHRQLENLKAIMAAHSGPILMAGDFNTWNQKRLDLVKQITAAVQLTEVADFPRGRTTGDTKSEFWNGVFGVEKDLPLDRVFFSGFTPRSARVLGYDTSDHKPMLVKLTLQP